MTTQHTVKAYDQELQRLESTIVEMGGLAEKQIAAAIEAVVRRDEQLAAQVIEGDRPIDALDRQVADLTVRLFALRQPVAVDLRAIVGALRISADLERIGDYASNIAKRAVAMGQLPPVRPVVAIPRLGTVVREMLKDVLDAFAARDVERAVLVWRRDQDLDDLYTSLFREVLTYMMEDARNITPCVHLMFIAKNLERIGDHATNIAETIYFVVRGETLPGARPKGDETSYAVAGPKDGRADTAPR